MTKWILIFSLILGGRLPAADLTLTNGRVLRDYELMSIDAKVAIIRHGGQTYEGVPLALLPADMPRTIKPAPGKSAEVLRVEEQAQKKREAVAARAQWRRITGKIMDRRGDVLRVECPEPPAPPTPVTDNFMRQGLSLTAPSKNKKAEDLPGARDPLLDVAPVYGNLVLKGVDNAALYKLGDWVRVAAERAGDSAEFGRRLPSYVVKPLPD